MNMEKEDILLQKRFVELANRSYTQNIFTFTDFKKIGNKREKSPLFQLKILFYFHFNVFLGCSFVKSTAFVGYSELISSFLKAFNLFVG